MKPSNRKAYDPDTFSYGLELELGDVPRSLCIPERYGAWEYAETDIVNVHPPYQYVAADPLGLEPPVGGEINTRPTRGHAAQAALASKLLNWIRRRGHMPTRSCVAELHVHVHGPGLTEDVDALCRFVRYVGGNQHDAIRACQQFDQRKIPKGAPGVGYLKYDIGRPTPAWLVDNLCAATDFQDFLRIYCCGRDGVSRGRPLRYGINLYCLKHTRTVEFRMFRATVCGSEIADCLRFVHEFTVAALNNGPRVEEILRKRRYQFPPFTYDEAEMRGWLATRWSKERGTKERRYVPV